MYEYFALFFICIDEGVVKHAKYMQAVLVYMLKNGAKNINFWKPLKRFHKSIRLLSSHLNIIITGRLNLCKTGKANTEQNEEKLCEK